MATLDSPKIVHVLQRRLVCPNGQHAQYPMQAFSRQEDAKEMGDKLDESIEKLLDCDLVRQVGPGQVEPTHISLREFLSDMGILGVDHIVISMQVLEGVSVIEELDRRIISPAGHA